MCTDRGLIAGVARARLRHVSLGGALGRAPFRFTFHTYSNRKDGHGAVTFNSDGRAKTREFLGRIDSLYSRVLERRTLRLYEKIIDTLQLPNDSEPRGESVY
jgi:hypothetical protein